MNQIIKGEAITSIEELLKQEEIIFNHKIVPKSWFMGWTIKQTQRNIEKRKLFKSLK